jgi:hypothetical protein
MERNTTWKAACVGRHLWIQPSLSDAPEACRSVPGLEETV